MLLNCGGRNGKLELPCYVEIIEEGVRTVVKRMKKGRVAGIDEVYTEMIVAGEEVGVSWTKRLLNVHCLQKVFTPLDFCHILLWFSLNLKWINFKWFCHRSTQNTS